MCRAFTLSTHTSLGPFPYRQAAHMRAQHNNNNTSSRKSVFRSISGAHSFLSCATPRATHCNHKHAHPVRSGTDEAPRAKQTFSFSSFSPKTTFSTHSLHSLPLPLLVEWLELVDQPSFHLPLGERCFSRRLLSTLRPPTRSKGKKNRQRGNQCKQIFFMWVLFSPFRAFYA